MMSSSQVAWRRWCLRLVLLVGAFYSTTDATYTHNCIDSSTTGDDCLWSDGREGTCRIYSGGFYYCDECSTASDCTGPADCRSCGSLPEFGASRLCDNANVGYACTYNSVTGTCDASGACQNSVQNDPVIQGFDGRIRHCDEVGDFMLLREASGRKVDVTFSGAVVDVGEQEPQEKSWTTSVRFTSPNGDTVSCSLPGVQPNTSTVTVMATPAREGAGESLLTSLQSSVALEEMSVEAVLSWKEHAGVQYSIVVGCKVTTPAYAVTVYQVSGWEEAQAKPEEHGWAAPYTWLNLGLRVTSRLEAPVTGILGNTYPKDLPPLINQAALLGQDSEEGADAGHVSGSVSLETVDVKPAPPTTPRGRALFQKPKNGVFTANLGLWGDLW